MAEYDVSLFYARGDGNSANNPNLNVENTTTQPVLALQFVEADGSTKVTLDFESGDVDPDTKVLVGDDPVPKDVIFEFSGTLPFIKKLENVSGFDLTGLKVAVVTIEGERYFFLYGTDLTEAEMIEVMNAFPNGAVPLVLDPPGDVFICFAAETPIDTPQGRRPAGEIDVGDEVTTDAGALPVLWTGRRQLSAAELAARSALWPVEIPAHALGPGVPSERLRFSPAHRVLLSGWQVELLTDERRALCPASALADAGRARRVVPPEGVTYVHLMFATHRLVTSAGLASESFAPGPMARDALGAAAWNEAVALLRTHPKDGGTPLPPSLRRFEARAILGD